METSTIVLLESYNPDITELDISGETITPTINGILDLSRFVSLKELNCSLNYIRSIINFIYRPYFSSIGISYSLWLTSPSFGTYITEMYGLFIIP